jgi:hypothetical protein
VSYKGPAYDAARTDLFSLDAVTGERRLIFSDEHAPIVLLQHLYVFHFPVTGGNRVFAYAAERGKLVPFPGNGDLYELSADGTSAYRRIGQVLGDGSAGDLFASASGDRVGYVGRQKQRNYLCIYNAASGAMVHQADVTDSILDCYVASIGWEPHGDRLFLTLEVGDIDATSEASYGHAGTYFLDGNAGRWARLRPPAALSGYLPPESAWMVGTLPSGRCLYETLQRASRPTAGSERLAVAIVTADSASGRADAIPFSTANEGSTGHPLSLRLSPSGRYLAAASTTPSASATSQAIWLKDLDSGAEKTLASIACDGMKGPFLGLVGWLDR